MIGFFNMKNCRIVLQLLQNGKELQYIHAVYGKVNVRMNPQRNRIIVSENENINESNILTFAFRGTGEWWLNSEY